MFHSLKTLGMSGFLFKSRHLRLLWIDLALIKLHTECPVSFKKGLQIGDIHQTFT